MTGLAAPIHEADCSIWDTPDELRPDALMAIGYRDERTVLYLSALRPIYDACKRCIGQVAGLILLIQVHGLDRHRSDALRVSIREQLDEAAERIRALDVPQGERKRFGALAALLQNLDAITRRLDRQVDLIRPSNADLDVLMKALFSAQRVLLRAAEPRAGLAPVDFTAACCGCRTQMKIRTT